MEHLQILLVRWDRHLYELHRLAKHAAEDFGGLRIGQLAAGDLQLQADEVLWALKSKRHESADIVGCNSLIWLVGSHKLHQASFEEFDLFRLPLITRHKTRKAPPALMKP